MTSSRTRALVGGATLVALAAGVAPALAATSSGTDSRPMPVQLLSSTAPYYQKLPASTPKASDSDALRAALIRQTETYYGSPGNRSLGVNTDGFTPTMYAALPTDPVAKFVSNNCQGKGAGWDTELLNDQLKDVRMPADAIPDSSTDGSIIVWDKAQDRITETWVTKKLGANTYSVCWGATLRNASKSVEGRYSSNFSVSASGLTQAAYVVRAQELQAGRITHMINLGIPETKAWPSVSWPARSTDGGTQGTALSIGQVLRIPASVNLDSLKLSPVAKMYAKAAQDYGIIVSETSGSVAFSAENPSGLKSNPYPSIFRNRYGYEEMQGDRSRGEVGFPLELLEVLPMNYKAPLNNPGTPVPPPTTTPPAPTPVPTTPVTTPPTTPPATSGVTVTGVSANEFSVRASSVPPGGKLEVFWTRGGRGQSTSTTGTVWSSGGSQYNWSQAWGQVRDASGTVVAKSTPVNFGGSTTPTTPPTATTPPAPAHTVGLLYKNATDFAFRASSLPAGGKMVISWTRDGRAQSTSTTSNTWSAGNQYNWANAKAVVMDSAGRVVAQAGPFQR